MRVDIREVDWLRSWQRERIELAIKRGFKQVSAAATVMLVLGMAGAPAFADQGGHFDHGKKHGHEHHRYDNQGQGNQDNQGGPGQGGPGAPAPGGPGLVGPAAPPAPPAPQSMGQAQAYLGLQMDLDMNLGPAGWLGAVPPRDRGPQGPGRGRLGLGDDRFISGTSLISLLTARQKADDPLVQSDLQALQSEIQAAVALQTASAATTTTTTTSTATTANTSSDLTIEQQMQAILSQMVSATSTDQLMNLLQQLAQLGQQLNASVTGQQGPQGPAGQWQPPGPQGPAGQWQPQGPEDQQPDLGRAIDRAKYDLNRIENRYDDINQNVTNYLNLYGSSASSLSGDQIREGLRMLVEYRDVSFWAMRALERVDDALTLIVQSDGGSSTTTSTATGTSTGTTTTGTTQGSGPAAASDSTVALSAGTIAAGQSVTVSGTVENASGQVLANYPVTVAVDGHSADTTTDASGQYSVSLTPTAALANGAVTVTADGVDISGTSDVLTVTAAAPATLSSTVTNAIYVGANTEQTITYTLLDAYGNPVVGQTVNFAIQQKVGATSETSGEAQEASGTLSAASGVTNAQGQVSVTYTSSPTADADGDLTDVVVASIPSTSVSNTQAQFNY